jgi:hypothetical protein
VAVLWAIWCDFTINAVAKRAVVSLLLNLDELWWFFLQLNKPLSWPTFSGAVKSTKGRVDGGISAVQGADFSMVIGM